MKLLVTAKHRSLLVFLWLALFSVQAFAEIDNADVLDNVLARYAGVASTWGNYITNRASWLFWTLVVISMIFTFGFMALRKADLGEFYAEFARFTIFTGFFWWLLINGPTFAMAIMDSLRQIGAQASGLPSQLKPSGIVDVGFDIFAKVVDLSSVWAPVDSMGGLIIAGIILVVFALVGVNMLLLLVSGWMLAYAGIFFLGFGGSRWTSEMAIGYYRTVLNIAVQLCVTVMLVGIGKSFVDQYYANMNAGVITLKELGVMLVVAIVLLALVNKVPGLIGSIAGGNTGSLGGGFGVGAAVGAAAVLGAGMATAGAAIAAGTAGLAGGAQAVMAAVSKANAAESAGGGGGGGLMQTAAGAAGPASGLGSPLASAMGEGAGLAADTGSSASTSAASKTGTAGSGGSGGSTASGTGTSSRAQAAKPGAVKDESAPGEVKRGGAVKAAGAAVAKAGRVAAGTASNLAVGTWDVAKGKLVDMKGSALDRIGESTGGKIAAAIKARGATDKPVTFGDDSLSAAAEPGDRESEVAAFRDRA